MVIQSTAYGQQWNSTMWDEYIEEQLSKAFEKEFNITGVESQQEMRIKIFLTVCNNPEKYSNWIEIDPKVFKNTCDEATKVLRERGLIQ